MSVERLEPTKLRSSGTRRPTEPPRRRDQALRSYKEGRAFSIRKPTEREAQEVAKEIRAAVYWLVTWEGMDVRARPYVTEHWQVPGGSEMEVSEHGPAPAEVKLPDGRKVAPEHYWKANFWVHDPLDRGMRQMTEEQKAEFHRRSAAVRGVILRQGSGARAHTGRRTVEVRDED